MLGAKTSNAGPKSPPSQTEDGAPDGKYPGKACATRLSGNSTEKFPLPAWGRTLLNKVLIFLANAIHHVTMKLLPTLRPHVGFL